MDSLKLCFSGQPSSRFKTNPPPLSTFSSRDSSFLYHTICQKLRQAWFSRSFTTTALTTTLTMTIDVPYGIQSHFHIIPFVPRTIYSCASLFLNYLLNTCDGHFRHWGYSEHRKSHTSCMLQLSGSLNNHKST